MASVTEQVSDGFVPIRCATWAVEDAVDGTLAPNAEGRLFVLATVGGWPSALVDARADRPTASPTWCGGASPTGACARRPDSSRSAQPAPP